MGRNPDGSITRMKNEPYKVDPPRICIHKYCLFLCEKKGRKGSKRDLDACPEIKCPLFPYRTGMLKARRGELTIPQKAKIISKLETARKRVRMAEQNVDLAKEGAARYEKRVEEAERKVEEAKKKAEEYRAEKIGAKQAELEKARRYVAHLEGEFNDYICLRVEGSDEGES